HPANHSLSKLSFLQKKKNHWLNCRRCGLLREGSRRLPGEYRQTRTRRQPHSLSKLSFLQKKKSHWPNCRRCSLLREGRCRLPKECRQTRTPCQPFTQQAEFPTEEEKPLAQL